VGDTDLELLSLSARLYRQLGLKRAYYSGFSPVIDTPFENLPPADPQRERRLYQASFLLRDYGFDLEELPFEGEGDLPQQIDPKRAWADLHLLQTPLEINSASRGELMRVPGLGAKGADRIVAARRKGRLRGLADLRAVGVVNVNRLAPYVLLDGRRPVEQPRLF